MDLLKREFAEEPLAWFAVRVRSNHERTVCVHLRERGYEEFAPSHKTESRWSDRRKTIDKFLFPGYVFSRLNPEQRLPVLTIPGVVTIVGFGRQPCPVPDSEIAAVRTMVESGLLVSPWPFLKQGQRVLMEKGPLCGLQGIVQDFKGQLRLVVSINLLQRSVSAEVDRTWIRPLAESQTRSRLTHGAWIDTGSPEA